MQSKNREGPTFDAHSYPPRPKRKSPAAFSVYDPFITQANAGVKIALGTAQFGLDYGIANSYGKPNLSAVRDILDCARTWGVGMLDTAIAYGDSEARLGELNTAGFDLVTKLPGLPAGCDDVSTWVQLMTQRSMLRLGVTELYGLVLHRPADLLGSDGPALANALEDAKASGRVRKIGISIYGPNELAAIAGLGRFDLVQAPFNLLDRRLETSGWLERLYDKGTEIHARSIFLQGLLLMPQPEIPVKFAPWSALFDKWSNWLAGAGVSPVAACVGYAMSYREIDRVVVGVDNRGQLAEIVCAASRSQRLTWPEIGCADEKLINPAMWSSL